MLRFSFLVDKRRMLGAILRPWEGPVLERCRHQGKHSKEKEINGSLMTDWVVESPEASQPVDFSVMWANQYFKKLLWVYLSQTDNSCWEAKSQQIEKMLQSFLQLILYVTYKNVLAQSTQQVWVESSVTWNQINSKKFWKKMPIVIIWLVKIHFFLCIKVLKISTKKCVLILPG